MSPIPPDDAGKIELGVFTFADLSGAARPEDRLRDVVDFGGRADQVGLQVFGVGEHHTPRFAVASPAVVLGAIAGSTAKIKLTSAVSVLSVLDPVRLYQDFAQLDLVSGGRAEITAGRSAYGEPFKIFGVPVAEYDAVFEEKLDLLLRLRLGQQRPITWNGVYRAPLQEAVITPSLQRPLPVRLGVGGTPASAVRAARLGLPMTLALLLGRIDQARSIGDLYWRTAREYGHSRDQLGIGTVGHLHIGRTPQLARDTYYPHYRAYVADGRGINISRNTFDAMAGPDGALMVGSPQEIAEKILRQHELLHLDRFLGQADLGGLPPGDVLQTIELLGTDVSAILQRRLS